MSVIVSDTSPLRALGHLGLLDLLRVIYGQLLVPPAVAQELLHPPRRLPVVDASQLPFVRIQTPQDQNRVQQFRHTLDLDEWEALALALEVQAKVVLIDEAAGRAMATKLGLQPVGVLGILLESKRRGLIHAIRPLIERLENEIRFFISSRIRARVLRLAGE